MHDDPIASKLTTFVGRFNVLTPWTTVAVCRNPRYSQRSEAASEEEPVCEAGYTHPEMSGAFVGALPSITDADRRAGPPRGRPVHVRHEVERGACLSSVAHRRQTKVCYNPWVFNSFPELPGPLLYDRGTPDASPARSGVLRPCPRTVD